MRTHTTTRSAAIGAAVLASAIAFAPVATAGPLASAAQATTASGIASTVPDEGGTSSFTLPVLPDTQFYSRYSASQFYPQYGTNPFEVQTQWIVDHQDELDIPFVAHVGDVVDQSWVTDEWTAASRAMQILTDGGVPYSVLPGNHDVDNMSARSSEGNSWYYLQNFNASRMEQQAGSMLVGTFQNGLSSAYVFEAEGHEWMSLAIAWNASADTFAWAQSILDQYPGMPVILSSHAIINIAEDQVSPAPWGWGDELWDNLIRHNDQIIVTLNGHFHGSTMQTRTNDAGNPVYQILTDYQMAADGGNGIMTTLEFDLTHDRIDVETISPWVTVKDEASRASSDTPVLDGPWQSFSLDMDFQERFGWDAPTTADGADLSELAKEIVSEGWDGDANGSGVQAAGSRDDYIKVDGTVAHWQFGAVDEGVVDENVEIPDVAGSSPMRRNPIDATDAPDALDDVYVTHSDVPYYSADAGAICFADVSRNAPGGENLSFISTEYGAPATFADLSASTGYTIETFLKLDEDWSEANNRWSAALTRGGARQWIGINDNSDPGAGAAWLGISSLREYQYSAGDSRDGYSYTLWSGEIMPGAWHHVAIVNDPVAQTAIMYVDGVPVLRNASYVAGMMAADYMPWIIGTSTWDTEPDHGWFGCVGETRVVDHALDASEFLTARADLNAGFSLETTMEGAYPAGTTFEAAQGAGYPGATVTAVVDGTTLGTATVSDAGAWAMTYTSPITGAGEHKVTFTQAIGSRASDSLTASFTIEADPSAPEPSPAPGDGGANPGGGGTNPGGGGTHPGEEPGETPGEGSDPSDPGNPTDPDAGGDLPDAGTATPDEDDLTAQMRGAGGVDVPASAAPGDRIWISFTPSTTARTLHAWVFSTPVSLGSRQVIAGTSSIAVTIPSDLPAGTHRIALYDEAGQLIGWDSITITGDGELAWTGLQDGVWAMLLGAVALIGVGAAALVWWRRASMEA